MDLSYSASTRAIATLAATPDWRAHQPISMRSPVDALYRHFDGRESAVPRLDDWLQAQGLGQHTSAFVANDIDFDVLVELGDQDLEKLGLSLGHRRKLLGSIATWKQTRDERERAAPSSGPAVVPVQGGERRQVTVMFCDLVGSTALANRLDPEDMAIVLGCFHDACSAAIVQFDGFVAKFMGDGVLAYFGYPRANEDAAEHAIRAAIAIVNALPRLAVPQRDELQARIGIATGTVMIGDIIGAGPAREHSIVGETPNLAARLQALAEPKKSPDEPAMFWANPDSFS